jgi:hypothetical protein
VDSTADSLTAIFDRLGSDKGTSGHGHLYSRDYATLIGRDIKRLCEIGIGTHLNFNGSCGSILSWLEWLPETEIVGFDLINPTVEINNPRFRFVQGDQGSRESLSRLAAAIDPVDVIIDDGSHLSEHQWLSLNVLWNALSPGGLYVIEDAHFRWGQSPHPIDLLPADPRFHSLIGQHGGGVVLRKNP